MATLTPGQRTLFSDPNFVTLSTTARDGSPRSIVLWVDVEGDAILVNGTHSRLWLRTLERDPRVALAIFDLANPYRCVFVRGTVTELSDAEGDEHYGHLMRKYRGEAHYQQRVQQGGPIASEPRVRVRIRPDKVMSRGVTE